MRFGEVYTTTELGTIINIHKQSHSQTQMPKPSAPLKQPDTNAETERTTKTNSKMVLSPIWLGFD
jgi:hypothetical protein